MSTSDIYNATQKSTRSLLVRSDEAVYDAQQNLYDKVDAKASDAENFGRLKDPWFLSGAFAQALLMGLVTGPIGLGVAVGLLLILKTYKLVQESSEKEGRFRPNYEVDLEPAYNQLKDFAGTLIGQTHKLKQQAEKLGIDPNWGASLDSIYGLFDGDDKFKYQFNREGSQVFYVEAMHRIVQKEERLNESLKQAYEQLEAEIQSKPPKNEEEQRQQKQLLDAADNYRKTLQSEYSKVKHAWMNATYDQNTPWSQVSVDDSDGLSNDLDASKGIKYECEIREEDLDPKWGRQGIAGQSLAQNPYKSQLKASGGKVLKAGDRLQFTLKKEMINGKAVYKVKLPRVHGLCYIQLKPQAKMQFWEAVADAFLKAGERCVDPNGAMSIDDQLLAATAFMHRGACPSDRWFDDIKGQLIKKEDIAIYEDLKASKQNLQAQDLQVDGDARATAEIESYMKGKAAEEAMKSYEKATKAIRQGHDLWTESSKGKSEEELGDQVETMFLNEDSPVTPGDSELLAYIKGDSNDLEESKEGEDEEDVQNISGSFNQHQEHLRHAFDEVKKMIPLAEKADDQVLEVGVESTAWRSVPNQLLEQITNQGDLLKGRMARAQETNQFPNIQEQQQQLQQLLREVRQVREHGLEKPKNRQENASRQNKQITPEQMQAYNEAMQQQRGTNLT